MPGRSQAAPDVTILLRHVVEKAARRSHWLARDPVEVFEPQRDPRQRRSRAFASHPGLRKTLVGAGRYGHRLVLVDAHPGIDRRRISVVAVCTVALTDPGQACCDELGRGHAALREQSRRLAHAESGQLPHRKP